jgi:hypothetical protein
MKVFRSRRDEVNFNLKRSACFRRKTVYVHRSRLQAIHSFSSLVEEEVTEYIVCRDGGVHVLRDEGVHVLRDEGVLCFER